MPFRKVKAWHFGALSQAAPQPSGEAVAPAVVTRTSAWEPPRGFLSATGWLYLPYTHRSVVVVEVVVVEVVVVEVVVGASVMAGQLSHRIGHADMMLGKAPLSQKLAVSPSQVLSSRPPPRHVRADSAEVGVALAVDVAVDEAVVSAVDARVDACVEDPVLVAVEVAVVVSHVPQSPRHTPTALKKGHASWL